MSATKTKLTNARLYEFEAFSGICTASSDEIKAMAAELNTFRRSSLFSRGHQINRLQQLVCKERKSRVFTCKQRDILLKALQNSGDETLGIEQLITLAALDLNHEHGDKDYLEAGNILNTQINKRDLKKLKTVG